MCTHCFRLAADATRHRILSVLKRSELLSVSALTSKIGVSQPTVSHHLRKLADAGLVKSCPDGRRRLYALSLKSECFLECGLLKGI